MLLPASVLEEWARQINAQEFFEAHETVEAAWREAREPERSFLKGLIHAAAALHHHRRGNAHGYRVKRESARRYLSSPPGESAFDIAAFLRALDALGAPGEAPARYPLVERCGGAESSPPETRGAPRTRPAS